LLEDEPDPHEDEGRATVVLPDDPQDEALPEPEEDEPREMDDLPLDDPQELDREDEENDDPPLLLDPPPQELWLLEWPPPKLLLRALAPNTSACPKSRASTRARLTIDAFMSLASSAMAGYWVHGRVCESGTLSPVGRGWRVSAG